MAGEKVFSIEPASAKAAVQSKGKLGRLQKECDLNRQRIATFKSLVTIWHKDFELVTSKDRNLEPENAKLRKELETSFPTQVKTKSGFAKDLSETRDKLDLEKRE